MVKELDPNVLFERFQVMRDRTDRKPCLLCDGLQRSLAGADLEEFEPLEAERLTREGTLHRSDSAKLFEYLKTMIRIFELSGNPGNLDQIFFPER